MAALTAGLGVATWASARGAAFKKVVGLRTGRKDILVFIVLREGFKTNSLKMLGGHCQNVSAYGVGLAKTLSSEKRGKGQEGPGCGSNILGSLGAVSPSPAALAEKPAWFE